MPLGRAQMMSTGRSPGSGSARSVAAVNLLRRSSAPLRPSVTATTDRADSLLRASPKADPPSRHERAAPLRCRGEPDARRRGWCVAGSRSGIVGQLPVAERARSRRPGRSPAPRGAERQRRSLDAGEHVRMMRWPTMPSVAAAPGVHVAWTRDGLAARRSRREAADGGLSPFRDGRIQPGATRAVGVTEEHPLRRETGGFVGVAPGITRGAMPVWLLLPESVVCPARTASSEATALRPRCDSSCDSSRWIQSRPGAAQWGLQRSGRRGPRSSSSPVRGLPVPGTLGRCPSPRGQVVSRRRRPVLGDRRQRGAAVVWRGRGAASSDNCRCGARAEPGSRPQPPWRGGAERRPLDAGEHVRDIVLSDDAVCGLHRGVDKPPAGARPVGACVLRRRPSRERNQYLRFRRGMLSRSLGGLGGRSTRPALASCPHTSTHCPRRARTNNRSSSV